MSRLTCSLLLTALSLAACGVPGDGKVHISVVLLDGAKGTVGVIPQNAPETGKNCSSGEGCTFSSGGTYALTPMPVEGSVFVGWSDDCAGTGPVTVTVPSGEELSCTATFEKGATPPPPARRTEGILAAETKQCQADANGALSCNSAPGGAYDVSAPPPALEAQFSAPNEFCYGFTDVDSFPSEDHGVVHLRSGLGLDVVTEYVGDDYLLRNLPPGKPFGDIDDLTVETVNETAVIPVPATAQLVDNGRYEITTGLAPDFWRVMAFGPTETGVGGVICELPGSPSVEITPDPLIQAAVAIGLVDIGALMVGPINQQILTQWDDQPRSASAGRLFIFNGTILRNAGELDDLPPP